MKSATSSAARQGHSHPPANLEAERALLACVLLDARRAFAALGQFDSQDLYDLRHRLVFERLRALHAANQPANLSALVASLSQDELEQCGGPAAVASLLDGAHHPEHAAWYGEKVREAAKLRRLRGLLLSALRAIESQAYSATIIIHRLQVRFNQILEAENETT